MRRVLFGFCFRFHLDPAGHSGRFGGAEASRQPDSLTLKIQAGFINSMANATCPRSEAVLDEELRTLMADVMAEVIAGMQTALPEPSLEEIDHWLNCNNIASSITGWYGKAEEFVEEAAEARDCKTLLA